MSSAYGLCRVRQPLAEGEGEGEGEGVGGGRKGYPSYASDISRRTVRTKSYIILNHTAPPLAVRVQDEERAIHEIVVRRRKSSRRHVNKSLRVARSPNSKHPSLTSIILQPIKTSHTPHRPLTMVQADFLSYLDECVSTTEQCAMSLATSLQNLQPGIADLPRLSHVMRNSHVRRAPIPIFSSYNPPHTPSAPSLSCSEPLNATHLAALCRPPRTHRASAQKPPLPSPRTPDRWPHRQSRIFHRCSARQDRSSGRTPRDPPTIARGPNTASSERLDVLD